MKAFAKWFNSRGPVFDGILWVSPLLMLVAPFVPYILKEWQ